MSSSSSAASSCAIIPGQSAAESASMLSAASSARLWGGSPCACGRGLALAVASRRAMAARKAALLEVLSRGACSQVQPHGASGLYKHAGYVPASHFGAVAPARDGRLHSCSYSSMTAMRHVRPRIPAAALLGGGRVRCGQESHQTTAEALKCQLRHVRLERWLHWSLWAPRTERQP